jgi:hypothetical protein
MPRIDNFFKEFNEIAYSCSEFSKINVNGFYEDFIKWKLADIPETVSDLAPTYVDRTATNALAITRYLNHLARYLDPNWETHAHDWGFFVSLLLRSGYFWRRYRQGLEFLDHYEGLDVELTDILKEGASAGDLPIFAAALLEFQNLGPINLANSAPEGSYDVRNWARGYTGQMGFFAAITDPNENGGKFKNLYGFPDAVGDDFIVEGELISSRVPLQVHSSPMIPAESILKQAISYVDPILPDIDKLKTAFARRVFFEIDFLTGFNVAPFAGYGAGDVALPADRIYQVRRIDESVIDRTSVCLVVSLKEIDTSWDGPYRDMIDGGTIDTPILSSPSSRQDVSQLRDRFASRGQGKKSKNDLGGEGSR